MVPPSVRGPGRTHGSASRARSPASGRGGAPGPRAVGDTRHTSACRFGAVCPAGAVAAGLVLPCANAQALNADLAEIARTVTPGADSVLILDGAVRRGRLARREGSRRARQHHAPAPAALRARPGSSPGLSRSGTPDQVRSWLWAYLRANKLAITVFDSDDDIVTACCSAWNFFATDPKAIASITSRTWTAVC